MIDWKKATAGMVKTSMSIVNRAAKMAEEMDIKIDRISLNMDLLAAAIVEKINLEKLVGFDDSNLGHDVFGISRHINRDNGKLGNGFWPRCGSVKS